MDSQKLKREILRLMQRNARISSQECAARLQTTADTVERLIAEMEQDRTILGYSTLVNEEQLSDNGVRALIEVEVQPERDGGFDRVARTISRP